MTLAALVAVPVGLTCALAVLLSGAAAACGTPAGTPAVTWPAGPTAGDPDTGRAPDVPPEDPVLSPRPSGGAGQIRAAHVMGQRRPRAALTAPFDAEQVENARAIVATGAQLGVPLRGWVIAVATAIQESSLRAVTHGDQAGPDSLGLFQQRTAWGTRAARLNPARAARMFYLGGAGGQPGLLSVAGWQAMPLAQAANHVQHSADQRPYARHEGEATRLVAAITGGAAGVTSCQAPGGPSGDRVVAFARGQLGVPYRWGGDGPGDGGFDCSGLTAAAYASVGISLPRTAQTQYDAGPHLTPGDGLRPGDLVFFGSGPRRVKHVGIVVGDGQMIDAPHRGAVVRVESYARSTYLGATRPTSGNTP